MPTRWASVLTPALLTRMSRRPKVRERLFDAALDRRLLADVHLHGNRAGQLARRLLRAGAVDIGDDDRRAAIGEASGDRPADARGGAGYEGHPAGQIGLHGRAPAGDGDDGRLCMLLYWLTCILPGRP